MMSNLPHTVVGVMPEEFVSLPQTLLDAEGQFYRPVAEPYEEAQRSSRHLRAIARLKPGVSLAQAQAEVGALAQRLAEQHPDDNAGYSVRVASFVEDTVGDVRTTLIVLFASVGFVLLIACANVANLLLARSSARQREIAVRAALGASGLRIMRQLLTESVLLSLAGGVAGLLLGAWAVSLFGALAAPSVPQLRVNALNLDRSVFIFTAFLSVGSGVLFGLAPALATRQLALNTALKQGSGWAGSGRSRTRSALLVVQVATSLVLLVASGLMIRSFAVLRAIDPGFESADRLVMNVWLPFATYGPAEKNLAFYRELVRRVEALPEVRSAALVSTLPFSSFDTRGAAIEGRDLGRDQRPDPDSYFVSAGYLQAMGIAVREGRGFTSADNEKATLVALVNETFARQVWPGESAIGKRISISTGPNSANVWREIVGVVGDVRHYALDQPPRMQLYLPHTQFPTTAMTLVVHSPASPAPLTAAVRQQIRELDPGIAAFAISTMENLISDSVAVRRLAMSLISLFGGVALVLASVGIYGVIAYWVSQRTREMGIRVALGARRADILRLVMTQGLKLCAVGIALGLPFALGAGRLLRSLLYGVGMADPWVLLGVAVGFLGVALLATFLPARRATRVDPVVALRYE
jgi:putative ABC transport system permease protein